MNHHNNKPAVTKGIEQLHYIKLIQKSAQPLEPLPVTLSADWEELVPKDSAVFSGIRAVLFDLYGTLFISAAGEIAAAMDGEVTAELSEMAEYFRLAVKCLHKTAHAAGNVWPEIKTEEIWAGYRGGIPGGWELPQKMRRSLEKIGPRAAARCAGRELALHYELALNPVYPMPHAERVLRSLVSGGIRLGIISNAQFYSPLLFNAFFGESPAEMGFCPELLIYSFEEGEAKPSPRLFNMARERLAEQNIKPEETLYIGNDMRNDIIPATEAGFKAALFAGDRRSLRLRKGDPACAERKPSVVIKGLETLVLDHLKTDNKNND